MTPFVGQQVSVQDTLSSDNVDRLTVISQTGSITIVGEDRDDITIDAVKQSSSVRTDLDDLSVETSIRDGLLEIRVKFEGETGWLESEPSVDLDIAVPNSLEVEHVESVVGETTIRNVTGDIRVNATTGSITIEDIDGSVDARSTTGRIAITDVTGLVSAQATTGRVTLRDVGTTGDVRTTTGRIEAEIPAIDGDTHFTASTGRIEAAIATNLDAEIYAQSSTGSVNYDKLPLADVTSSSNSVRGRLGDGGPTLAFETDTGRIDLEPLE